MMGFGTPTGMGGGGAATPSGFFSSGGMLDRLASMQNPMMAQADIPPLLKVLGSMKVGFSGGGKSFNFQGPDQSEEAMRQWLERMFPGNASNKKAASTIQTVETGGDRPSRRTSLAAHVLDPTMMMQMTNAPFMPGAGVGG